MQQLVLIIHVLAAMGIIALVLLQHGKGSDVGAAFGAGSANTMMGSAGALPILLKITAFLGAVFFATSLILANMASAEKKAQSNIVTIPAKPASIMPIIPTTEPKNVPAVKDNGSIKNKTKPELKSSSSKKAVKATKKK